MATTETLNRCANAHDFTGLLVRKRMANYYGMGRDWYADYCEEWRVQSWSQAGRSSETSTGIEPPAERRGLIGQPGMVGE
jgi:hypothetical protein